MCEQVWPCLQQEIVSNVIDQMNRQQRKEQLDPLLCCSLLRDEFPLRLGFLVSMMLVVIRRYCIEAASLPCLVRGSQRLSGYDRKRR